MKGRIVAVTRRTDKHCDNFPYKADVCNVPWAWRFQLAGFWGIDRKMYRLS